MHFKSFLGVKKLGAPALSQVRQGDPFFYGSPSARSVKVCKPFRRALYPVFDLDPVQFISKRLCQKEQKQKI